MLQRVADEGISVIDFYFDSDMQGLCCDNMIAITKEADSDTQRKYILAEELGHHFKNVGDITKDRQEETGGRAWSYPELISLKNIIDGVAGECEYPADLAEHLEVTESYLSEGLAIFGSFSTKRANLQVIGVLICYWPKQNS